MVVMDLITPKVLCQINLESFFYINYIIKYREAKVGAAGKVEIQNEDKEKRNKKWKYEKRIMKKPTEQLNCSGVLSNTSAFVEVAMIFRAGDD